MSEDQTPLLRDEDIQKQFMRLPVLLVLGISVVAMYFEVLPKGMIGGMCFLLPLALILERIGARIPILRSYLGGSPLLLIFLGAGLVYTGIIPSAAVDNFKLFMKNSGSNFLNFYICISNITKA